MPKCDVSFLHSYSILVIILRVPGWTHVPCATLQQGK